MKTFYELATICGLAIATASIPTYLLYDRTGTAIGLALIGLTYAIGAYIDRRQYMRNHKEAR